jgi:hypothetical protein
LIPDKRLPLTVKQFNALKRVIRFNARYTQNRLGDGNLVQIAGGDDTDAEETERQRREIREEREGNGREGR